MQIPPETGIVYVDVFDEEEDQDDRGNTYYYTNNTPRLLLHAVSDVCISL